MLGIISHINPEGRFAYIRPDIYIEGAAPDGDVFVRAGELGKAGLRNVGRGDRVEFEAEPNKGRPGQFLAKNVRLAA